MTQLKIQPKTQTKTQSKSSIENDWLANKPTPSVIGNLFPTVHHEHTKQALQQWEAGFSFDWESSQLTHGLRHAMVDVGEGIQLSVEVGGNPNNPAILLIIGLGSQMIFWPDSFVYRLIEAGFFVIRFDNRDIGLSSKIKPNQTEKVNRLKMMLRMQAGLCNKDAPVAYTLTDMAEDTVRLIQRLELNQVNVMGASMGGIIAQLLSARYPELVTKLLLLFTTTNRAMLPPPKLKQLYTLFKRPASHSKEDAIAHSLWFMNIVGSPGFLDTEQIRRLAKIRHERSFHPLGTVQQLNAIFATGSIHQYSKQIQAPTLVLSGSKDGLVPASHGQDITRAIPNAKFQLIDGMGHDIPSYYQPYLVEKIMEHCFS